MKDNRIKARLAQDYQVQITSEVKKDDGSSDITDVYLDYKQVEEFEKQLKQAKIALRIKHKEAIGDE